MSNAIPDPGKRGARALGAVAAVLLLAGLSAGCSNGSNTNGSGRAAASRPPAGASRASMQSAVDGSDPWGVLGELTGPYSVVAERLESECVYGPDVPWSAGERVKLPKVPFGHAGASDRSTTRGFVATEPPFGSIYRTHLVQRGDDVVFELGAGLVFGRVDGALLVDVVRVGAEGVTRYRDPFEIEAVGDTYSIRGESRWTFFDDYWDVGAVCDGRTSWVLEGGAQKPAGDARDLHIVLRWPSENEADLDLMVEVPSYAFDAKSTGGKTGYLGHVEDRCYLLHSAGAAAAHPRSEVVGWIHRLSETEQPHHEEVYRCAQAHYGTIFLSVVNWSSIEARYEVEVFEGATLGVDPANERWIERIEGVVSATRREPRTIRYLPPPPPSSSVGLIYEHWVNNPPPARRPALRPADPVTRTVLGFNKAAAIDVPYEDFADAIEEARALSGFAN